MMDLKTIQVLFDYNHWANVRVLDAVAKLTPEQFTKDLENSFRSVRGTLVHILSAEWVWLERWLGTSPKSMLNPEELSDVAGDQRAMGQGREPARGTDSLAHSGTIGVRHQLREFPRPDFFLCALANDGPRRSTIPPIIAVKSPRSSARSAPSRCRPICCFTTTQK